MEQKITFSGVPLSLLDRVSQLESEGFPPDEAASRDTMADRLENASTFFVGTYLADTPPSTNSTPTDSNSPSNQTLIGYVAGTCSDTELLEHENMFKHDPLGTHLCIHSVLVEPKYQNKGFAKQALRNYVAHIKEKAPQIKKISLIAKESKTRLYESCGFKMLGKSSVVHGQDTWYELSMSLH